MRLTHVEVAYFMRITQQEAIKKIILIEEKDPKKADKLFWITDEISVESEEFDKHYGTNITFAANDVVNNCLKRSAFKKWLMHDWPIKAMDEANPPKVIQLPVPLRRLIKPEDKEEIRRYWDNNFRFYKGDKWTKNYEPIFEP